MAMTAPAYSDRMAYLVRRYNRFFACLRGADGKRHEITTGCSVDEEDKARAVLREFVREAAAAKAIAPDGPLTLARYAEAWLKKRGASKRDDRSRLTLHVLPRIGSMMLGDVRPKHLAKLIQELKDEGYLAPRTIRTISGLLHTMFKSAVIDELVGSNPCVFERGVLPKKLDKDTSWRAEAIYTRGEIETLLSSDLIPHDRRVLYALKFFVGRHSEVCRLTWANYDSEAKPLGALHLGITKSGVPRVVPVHRTLANILAAWKLGGWEAMVKRKPELKDLIIPTSNGTMRKPATSQHQLVGRQRGDRYVPGDLDALGLRTKAGKERHRRGHDLRRTLITLARSDGAIDSILRLITHGPKSNEILDIYSTPPWAVLCAEVEKLRIDLREGVVLKMEAV